MKDEPYRVAREHAVAGMLFGAEGDTEPNYIVTRTRKGRRGAFVKYRMLPGAHRTLRMAWNPRFLQREYTWTYSYGTLGRWAPFMKVWDKRPPRGG